MVQEKKGIIILDKKVGETPLQVLNNLKKNNSEYQNVKLAYAGRLDPMAEGKLLVLVGETCKERDKFLNLDKEYEFEILLDFKSDSQDILGLVEYEESPKKLLTNFFQRDKHWTLSEVVNNFFGFNSPKKNRDKFSKRNIKEKLLKILLKFVGKHNWKYPIFSSKTVQGKPLFLWSLENRISEIEIPRKEIEIYELELQQTRSVTKGILKKEIFEKINSLPEVKDESKTLGKDFRRKEIRERWNEIFDKLPESREFEIIKIRCQCSSGTYMRVLAEKIAQELGRFGLAYSIKRTRFLNL